MGNKTEYVKPQKGKNALMDSDYLIIYYLEEKTVKKQKN